MTTTDTSFKGGLVVPEQAIPAFQHVILPKSSSNVDKIPTTAKGKVQRCLRKSTLITAPVVGLSSMAGLILAPHVVEFSFFNALAVMTTGIFGSVSGLIGTMVAIESVFHGDRFYAPLPATKEFLEFEERKQKSIIQPFKDWDDVFARNNH